MLEDVAVREALVEDIEAKITSDSEGVPAGYAASRAATARRTTERHGGASQRTLWHPPPRIYMRHHNMWVDL